MVARHDHAWISFFMAAWSLGGALRQWPIGKASDTGGGKQRAMPSSSGQHEPIAPRVGRSSGGWWRERIMGCRRTGLGKGQRAGRALVSWPAKDGRSGA